MSTELIVTCDGCGQPIIDEHQHVRVVVAEVDNGEGISSAPVVNDYHADHVPKPMVQATGFQLNGLVQEE